MAALVVSGPASSEEAMRAGMLEHRQIERWRPLVPFLGVDLASSFLAMRSAQQVATLSCGTARNADAGHTRYLMRCIALARAARTCACSIYAGSAVASASAKNAATASVVVKCSAGSKSVRHRRCGPAR